MKTQRIKAITLVFIIAFISNGCDKSKRDWERVKGLNTIEAYDEFASIYPQSIFVDSAWQRIEELTWKGTLKENTIEAYQKFLVEYPQSIYTDSAKQEIEKLTWDRISKDNTIEAYQWLLENYPNISHYQQAKDSIDRLLSKVDSFRTTKRGEKYYFEGDFGSPMKVTITTEEGKRVVFCPLASQEEAIGIESKLGVVVPKIATVTSYLGYPFYVRKVNVDNSKMLYYTDTIMIEDVQSGFIIPSSKSTVPMEVYIISNDLEIIHWTQAINMVWEFTKPGIRIDDENRTLISEVKGAQIVFTKYGINLNNVKVIEK